MRFIEHIEKEKNRPVCVIESNHEMIRTLSGKQVGFVTDYACAVHVILLADYYNLDSIATGMPLENSYLWHGQKYRNFSETWFWKKHAPLFESIGLPILQPVMGCSEVVNKKSLSPQDTVIMPNLVLGQIPEILVDSVGNVSGKIR